MAAVSTRRPSGVLAWVLGGVALAEAVATLVLLVVNRDAADAASVQGDALRLALSAAVIAPFGAIVAAHRPRNPIGWLALGSAIVLGLSGLTEQWAVYSLATRPGTPGGAWSLWVAERPTAIVAVGLPVTLLLFPTGRALSRRWDVVMWVVIACGVAFAVAGSLHPQPLGGDVARGPLHDVANPAAWPAARPVLDVVIVAGTAVGLVSIVAGIVAVALRFRRGGPAGRARVKWLVWAGSLYVVGAVMSMVLSPGWQTAVNGVTTAAVTAAIAVAVLRHRLIDVDVVINRTFVYLALTVVVVAGYVAAVGVVAAVLRTGTTSLVTSLLATGIVAALFAPAHQWLQRLVDRYTYGDRGDPSRALRRLGDRLAAAQPPEELLPGLASAVAEALRLDYVEVAASGDETTTVVAAYGQPAPVRHRVPLVFQGVVVGELAVAGRSGGELTPGDLELLADLAPQAAVAVRAATTTTELRRSREQLVVAREEERRRISHDLHDGLGPVLAAVSMRAGVAERLVTSDPPTACRALAEISKDTQAAVAEVRRIVAGLRPAVLDQLGLTAALGAEAARYAPAFTVEVVTPSELDELPAAVEVAVLRIASEALANAARHANASGIRLDLAVTAEPSEIVLTIADDGDGLATRATGSDGVGLASMRERAAELDGECSIVTGTGRGTTVQARIPLPATLRRLEPTP